MNERLAGRLLDELLAWDDSERSEAVSRLIPLSDYKYDEYEGYRAGEGFFASLARWLKQFPDPGDRMRLLRFVLDELVFISRAEIDQAVAVAYRDRVRPELLSRAAEELEVPSYRVTALANSPEFLALQRQTLILGLSDGAALDRFRRANPQLSHEQIWLTYDLGAEAQRSRVKKLAEALQQRDLPGVPLFRHILLVDDFYGSGTSLIDIDDGDIKGKIGRFQQHLASELRRDDDRARRVVSDDAHVSIVLYIASDQAIKHIQSCLAKAELPWRLHVIQRLSNTLQVTQSDMIRLCNWYFDDALIDKHKGHVPLGFGNCALPVILSHNTPNNSVSLLWGDTTDRPGSEERRALFPRFERHHIDRP